MDQLTKSEEEDEKSTSGYWKARLVMIVEQGDEEALAAWRNDLRNKILEKQACDKVYEACRRVQSARRHAAKILSESKYRALMRIVERMLVKEDIDQAERLKEAIGQHKRKADELVEDKDKAIKRLKGRRRRRRTDELIKDKNNEDINVRLIRLSETKIRHVQTVKGNFEN